MQEYRKWHACGFSIRGYKAKNAWHLSLLQPSMLGEKKSKNRRKRRHWVSYAFHSIKGTMAREKWILFQMKLGGVGIRRMLKICSQAIVCIEEELELPALTTSRRDCNGHIPSYKLHYFLCLPYVGAFDREPFGIGS